MAIKPGDCILQLDKLKTTGTGLNFFGRAEPIDVYPIYWEKFRKHVDDTTDWSMGSDAGQRNMKKQLIKFNAAYKSKGGKEWVKFETAEDLLYFKLMWH